MGEYLVAPIVFVGEGGTEPLTVAALGWCPVDDKFWDLVAAHRTPAAEPILKEHFNSPGSRSADSIRRFVENGLKGYRMEKPHPVVAETATEAARQLLLERGIQPYR